MFLRKTTAHRQHRPRPGGQSLSQKGQSPTFSQPVLLIEIPLNFYVRIVPEGLSGKTLIQYDSLKTVSVAAMVNMDDKHIIRENRLFKCRVVIMVEKTVL